MKRILLIIVVLISIIGTAKAQNDTTIYVTSELSFQTVYICLNKYDRVALYAPSDCNLFLWSISWGSPYLTSSESIVFLDSGVSNIFGVSFMGCEYNIGFEVEFIQPNIPNETTTEIWKRQNGALAIEPIGLDSLDMYDFHWSTDETTAIVEVTSPGTYTCNISDLCATATRTFIVKDNVEIYRATVDLATGLNKVTWQTTPEQAEYINQVKVERDGFVVGTAPYEDGLFMDNIGSENAARNYRLTGITTEGDECPIPSYQLGTLHVDFSPNASNPNKLNMAWTAPYIEEGSPLTVSYFQICKYDPVTGEVTVVDQLGANNTIGSYNISLFEGGYATVAALFSEGRDYEEMSFSNMTEEILGVEENDGNQVRIYPNPAHGILYVETRRATSLPAETGYRIINPMGQTLMTGTVETCHGASLQQINIENLPQGMYFVTIGGVTRKFVVE